MEKDRVDVLLVKQGLFDSREQAKRAVMAGTELNCHNTSIKLPSNLVANINVSTVMLTNLSMMMETALPL